MQSGELEKTYIDSNIWFSYITEGKYDDTFYHVKKLINTILSENSSVIVISDLVVLEVLSVIRNKVILREPFTKGAKGDTQIQEYLQHRLMIILINLWQK
jgi:predicted nucleic acid-binding protein